MSVQFPEGAMEGVQIGASVAINGTCLTVVQAEGDLVWFDVIAETLRRTNLGTLGKDSIVNYERAARIGDEIGGHNVSGHVCTTASITSVVEGDSNRKVVMRVRDSDEWMKYILAKGFIAVDGCSLTIGEVDNDTFSVYLIPETIRVTVFQEKGEGDDVNIEIDAQTQAIVDTVERYMQAYKPA